MKRVYRKRICAASFLLALFALMQILCALRVQAIERSLPRAAALCNPSGVGMTMKQALSTDIKPAVGDCPNIIIGAASLEELQSVRVSGVGASATAYTAYATPLTGICMPLRYTYGNWFLSDESDMASLAVIPESLSLALFGTNQPAGNSLSVGQTDYRICGVYSEYGVFAEEKGFLNKISGDGIPRVYLYNPLRMAQLPVSELYLSDSEQSDAQLLKQQASSIYRTPLNGKIIDYRQQIQLAHSLWYLSLLMSMFFAILLLIISAGMQFLRLHDGQSETVSIRLKRLLAGACLTAISLILLMLLLSRLQLPQAYLTQDNIFDFSSYLKSTESFFTSLHTKGWPNRFEWVFITQLLVLMFWSLCGIVFFAAGVLKLRHLIRVALGARIKRQTERS